MSQNDIIIRTHYKSPHRLHIDSDIPTPSSEFINQFARQLITLLDTSDLSSMLSYCVIRIYRKLSKNITKIVFHCPFTIDLCHFTHPYRKYTHYITL